MKVVPISHPRVRAVKGRGLPRRKLSKPARALLGVDILQAQAKKLGLRITADANNDKNDRGPFLLRCGQTGYLVWGTGLSAELITDALNCYERELRSNDGHRFDAWRNFGTPQ